MLSLALIIPAAGSSTRMGGDTRKPFIQLLGLPIICHTLRRFQYLADPACTTRHLTQAILVVHPDDLDEIKSSYWRQLQQCGATHLIAGGPRRQDSVANALNALDSGVDIVLIHDAVRPFVPAEAVNESIRAAAETGAALVALPAADTVKRAAGSAVIETVPRHDLWVAQTPQVFQAALIREAMAAAVKDKFECTDDAQLVERLGRPVRLVRGSTENFKITTPDHLRLAEVILRSKTCDR